ncbi:MAG: Phosphoribosylformylglycinamidine synthase subunit PurL, partial [Alphaproteobacteria bacterium MarineAlpha2_Bin1]
YVFGNPKSGSKQAVAESWRNLICVGSKPIAITDCLNFGNPEKPEIMGQIVESIEGIKEATEFLDFPVISGNVSLYNETEGKPILPTPQIGAVGIIKDINNMARSTWNNDELIYILGNNDIELGCSVFDEVIEKTGILEPPSIDLEQEKKIGSFILNNIEKGLIKTCHDVSDGGILIAIAEMAINSKIGTMIETPENTPAEWWFSETQARYIVTISKDQQHVLEKAVKSQNIPITYLGIVTGNTLQIHEEMSISLDDLEHYYGSWLPSYIND